MNRLTAFAATLAAGLTLIPTLAQAQASRPCSGGHTFVADDFTKNPVNDPAFTVEDGKLKVKAAPDAIRWYAYRAKLTGNYDVCVTVQIPHRFDQAGVFAGVIFAAADLQNFTAFTINASGEAAVLTMKKSQFEKTIDWREVSGMNTDPGSKNQIRVSVKGNTATLYVNDTKFESLPVTAPNGGGQAGLLFSSEEGATDAWKFINFKATDLQ